jgi:hypothetical protein
LACGQKLVKRTPGVSKTDSFFADFLYRIDFQTAIIGHRVCGHLANETLSDDQKLSAGRFPQSLAA